MTNALANETSPYLLQHRDNPVDWLPWGEEALTRAREADRPLLVSIGYSACHWCHVMERESFEDPETAALMNERFVCVKVDREERPDIDAIYMEAVQAIAGRGGWPLNVFITPDQKPFFGGTYWPPEPRHGMPSWRQVLGAVAEAWTTQRERLDAQGDELAQRLSGAALLRPSQSPLDAAPLEAAIETLGSAFDARWGGWGGAPKFPAASVIELLLARGEHEMALATLRLMASGGIYDQIGGGFSRYAVDHTWTVPHFEKMLYDNALLARAYLHGWQVSGDDTLRRVATETLDFILRELRGPEGGFFSALDADSEGVEGKFYVWTLDELREELDPADFEAAIAWSGATQRGNFEGANVLEARGPEPPSEQRERIRATLLQARSRRVRPGLDDKRLTSWNALAIAALADAGAVLRAHGEAGSGADYIEAASAAARFVLDELRNDDDRLLRTWKDGRGHIAAYLEDHAFLLEALLVLYEATFDAAWFTAARELAETILERFADPDNGGFFSTASDHEPLVARRKELDEAPIPSGASSAAYGLLRLAALTGDHRYEAAAEGHLRLLHEIAGQHPGAFAHTLRALDFQLAPTREVALAGEDLAPLAAVVRERLRPHVVLAGGRNDDVVPLLRGREPVDGRPAAYVCERFTCRRPVTEPEDLRALLGS